MSITCLLFRDFWHDHWGINTKNPIYLRLKFFKIHKYQFYQILSFGILEETNIPSYRVVVLVVYYVDLAWMIQVHMNKYFKWMGKLGKFKLHCFCFSQEATDPTTTAIAWKSSFLNLHYNQFKFFLNWYMMLNRNWDRESGLPFCGLFETKDLIGMMLIPMFLLVSFGFERSHWFIFFFFG